MNIPRIIRAQINVDLIEKKHLYKGKKGTYLNVSLVNTPDSQFGQDYMVAQDVSKEDREAGVKGPILGNAEARYIEDGKQATKSSDNSGQNPRPTAETESSGSGLPF